MDQGLIAGIGNIYSEEILVQARLGPRQRIGKPAPSPLRRLYLKMREVLKFAIARGVGSEQFVERAPKGFLLPERHKGGRCPKCRAPLRTLKIHGRTAYCCSQCQPDR